MLRLVLEAESAAQGIGAINTVAINVEDNPDLAVRDGLFERSAAHPKDDPES